MPRPQEHDRRTCGTERVHQEFPLRFKLLLIVTRMGRDYRPGPRQGIEQVARHGSANSRAFSEDLTARQICISDNPVTPGCTIDHLMVIYDPDLSVVEA